MKEEGRLDRPVLVAWRRFGPYHHARLRAAAQLLPVVGLEISSVDKVNAWAPMQGAEGYQRFTLFNCRDVDEASTGEIRRVIERSVKDLDVRALAIYGWSDRTALLLLEWGLRHQKRVIVLSASNQHDAERWRLKEHIKRRIVRLCTAGVVGGTQGARYLQDLGLSADRISWATTL